MNKLLLLLTLLLFTACAPKEASDPLKNTKKLAIKGHTSLYENGMLEIPFTKVHLIPSLSKSMELSHELFFEDAKNALTLSLKAALDSVYIIPEGSNKAYEVSKDIYRVSDDISETIRKHTRSGGIWLLERSSEIAKDHIWGAFHGSKALAIAVYNEGDKIEAFFDVASSDIIDWQWAGTKKIFNTTMKIASKINKESVSLAKKQFTWGKNAFVEGYLALPSTLGKNIDAMGKSISASRFADAAKDANDFREKGSLFFRDIISDTVSNYSKETSESFSKVGRDFTKHVKEEGVVLSSLKSMRWLLQGIYEATIKPIAKLAVSTVGLISVNGIIYPIHLAVDEVATSTMVMVEVTANTAKSLYDIVAPSVRFAIASVLSPAEYVGGKVFSATTATLGTAVSGVNAVTGLTLAGVSKTTGFVAGKGTKYIGVPLAVSAKAVGKVGYGVLASGSSATLGTGVLATGESVALVTKGTGTVASGTSLVGGTGLSVVKAGVTGLYQLGKAVVVPSGYALSSGVALGYGSLSQLQAHTLLAASDAAYMVLSLEGPKWVLYTMSGTTIKEETPLPAGTVVNLKAMQEKDETIKRLEVSDQEMQKLLNSLDTDLPRLELKK